MRALARSGQQRPRWHHHWHHTSARLFRRLDHRTPATCLLPGGSVQGGLYRDCPWRQAVWPHARRRDGASGS